MNKFKKFNFTINIILILILFFGNLIFADSNGVWHESEDIKGGVFGSDEQDITSFYSFINRVSFNNEVFVYNNSLSITKNEGSLNLIGINHTYIQFYPNSEISGRKAWIGFGDANDDNLTISSENSVILNSISGGYYLGYISNATRIAKVPPLCIGAGAALQWDGNSWSCLISAVNGICSVTSGVCNAGSIIGDNGQTSCGTTRTWSCQGLNGGLNSGSCSYVNSACPVNGVCSASSGICSAGILIGDNGQTSCGTTRTWTCQGQYGGSNSGTCSYTNTPCPINGECSTSSGVCTAGTLIGDNSQISCGTTRTWTCQGQYGGSNSGVCSYTNVPCPINGVCGAASGTCSAGSIIGDNGLNSCDTTRTWTCQGLYGGSSSPTCSYNNGDCATPAIISTNIQNYNLKTALGNPTTALNVIVTIDPGVIVYSTSTSIPAFDTGALPAGSNVTIINNGKIIGKGGNGGTGYGWSLWASYGYTSTVGTAGENGGNALKVQVNTIITNNGVIAGGGGGGGGGGYAYNNYYFQNYASVGGGGGGGGQGYSPGTGGAGGSLSGYSSANGNYGTSGTINSAGSGASAATSTNSQGDGASITGSTGGNGGTYGNSGLTGGTGSAQYASGGMAGGAGGKAVVGNSYITWVLAGTRYGTIS